MVHIIEGGEPGKVPLVYYDKEGNRHVVGEAAVQVNNGEVIAVGKLDGVLPDDIPELSVSMGPFSVYEPSKNEKLAMGMGPLMKGKLNV